MPFTLFYVSSIREIVWLFCVFDVLVRVSPGINVSLPAEELTIPTAAHMGGCALPVCADGGQTRMWPGPCFHCASTSLTSVGLAIEIRIEWVWNSHSAEVDVRKLLSRTVTKSFWVEVLFCLFWDRDT